MIHYKTYKNIDFIKYDRCIQDSFNSRIYAFSWYLNCVTDDWDALVLNDYEVVMPLPKRSKLGLNYIYQVSWVQQLGIFSRVNIEENLILDFINKIPNKFVLVDYFFNSENKFDNKHLKKRINYILDLSKSFDEISRGFNTNRKRISKKEISNIKIDKKGRIDDFLNFYKKQEINYKTHPDSFEKLERLLKSDNNSVHIWTVKINNNLIAGLVWLKDQSRITYLVPVANSEAKKLNIPTYLVNELIKDHENSNYILDFEGSMNEGVAQFYKSFGAREEEYYWYRKRSDLLII